MPDIYLIIAFLVGVLERRKLEIKKTLMALGSAAGCCGFVEMCKFNLAPDNILFIGNWNQFYTSCEQNMQKVGCSSTEGVETMTLSLLVLFVVGCGVGLATIYAQPLKKWALKKHKVKTDR